MKTRTVKPCGFLYASSGDVWYLLSPYPVAKDSWQGDNTYRFVCVPRFTITAESAVYDCARHIVTNSFAIEYVSDLPEITIKVLEDIDVTRTELHDVSDEEVSNIVQEEDYEF